MISKRIYQLTRFAPSPTGYLHRGHILSAIWVWGLAALWKTQGVLLRIEDHDQSRCREEYVQAILEDLAWLGFRWEACMRQSEHFSRYERFLDQLRQQGLAYPCRCTRSELQAGGGSVEPRYPGFCRNRNLPWDAPDQGIRIQLPETTIAWEDLGKGSYAETPQQQCGDLLARDRQGQWTYQFAVTIDDWEEGVDLVIRGEDLRDSTARQIQLGRILGRPEDAHYLHHPLLHGADGQKLSKRQKSQSVRSERIKGISPQQLLGEVCVEGGILASYREVTISELPELLQASLNPILRKESL